MYMALVFTYHWAVNAAKERGMLDIATSYWELPLFSFISEQNISLQYSGELLLVITVTELRK
jgi:hypothetical protein